MHQHKGKKLKEIHRFLDTYNLTKFNYEDIECHTRPNKMSNENESVIKIIPTRKSQRPEGLTDKFCKAVKEEIIPILLKLFQKCKKKECTKLFQ
jgi:hypothetical protein